MLNPITQLQERPLRFLGHFLNEAVFTLFQLLLLSLILLGIGGLVVTAIGTDGWLPGILRRAWRADPLYALFALGALGLASGWLKRVFDARLAKLNGAGDMLIYGCLGLGVFFSLRLLITGSL